MLLSAPIFHGLVARMSVSFDFANLPLADLSDDGGRPLEARLLVTSDLTGAVAQAVAANWAVMPAGGLTSAIGSFDYKADRVAGFAGVLALRPKGAVEAELADPATKPEDLLTHQVMIDAERGLVAAGAGLTIAQVEAALAKALGGSARLLVDLTTVASAFVGGVVATGAMGPLRLRPSVSLEAVVLADGGPPKRIESAGLERVEGMQGWTGVVTAAVFRYYQVPPNEFGIVLPIQGDDVDTVAGFLAYLQPWTRISPPRPGGRLGDGDTVVNGVELIGRASLSAFVETAPEPAKSKAQGLLQSCDYAGADWLACITGWSEQAVDDVLFGLLDPQTETIGGVMIDYGVGFSSGLEMETFRAIREGAPDLARTRARVRPEGQMAPWSTSTDVNIRVSADSGTIVEILTAYGDYRGRLQALNETADGAVRVESVAYGHLSPNGIDPHHRVIVFADDGQDNARTLVVQAAQDIKRGLIRDLIAVAEKGGAEVTGGEKGLPSLIEIARALGGADNLPPGLKARFDVARAALAEAPANFSFRAPPELR